MVHGLVGWWRAERECCWFIPVPGATSRSHVYWFGGQGVVCQIAKGSGVQGGVDGAAPAGWDGFGGFVADVCEL